MTKVILSTSNLLSGGPWLLRRPAFERSNVELVNSLRLNFDSTKKAFLPQTNGFGGIDHTISRPTHAGDIALSDWTFRDKDYLFVPAIDFSQTGLSEERAQYDITVKIFFLPETTLSSRAQQVQEALDFVLKTLHVANVDLLIISFPNVSFNECSDQPEGVEAPNDMQDILKTWKAVEDIHDKGVALNIGVAEFGSERLAKFLPRTRVRPSVDQVNMADCCKLPPKLSALAKAEHIDLFTHSDCNDILPSGTIRELLGPGDHGADVLKGADGTGDGLPGDIKPQWVIKYTAVVKDRGVLEDKGYLAMAEIGQNDASYPASIGG